MLTIAASDPGSSPRVIGPNGKDVLKSTGSTLVLQGLTVEASGSGSVAVYGNENAFIELSGCTLTSPEGVGLWATNSATGTMDGGAIRSCGKSGVFNGGGGTTITVRPLRLPPPALPRPPCFDRNRRRFCWQRPEWVRVAERVVCSCEGSPWSRTRRTIRRPMAARSWRTAWSTNDGTTMHCAPKSRTKVDLFALFVCWQPHVYQSYDCTCHVCGCQGCQQSRRCCWPQHRACKRERRDFRFSRLVRASYAHQLPVAPKPAA